MSKDTLESPVVHVTHLHWQCHTRHVNCPIHSLVRPLCSWRSSHMSCDLCGGRTQDFCLETEPYRTSLQDGDEIEQAISVARSLLSNAKEEQQQMQKSMFYVETSNDTSTESLLYMCELQLAILSKSDAVINQALDYMCNSSPAETLWDAAMRLHAGLPLHPLRLSP
jgi:hypothetical protein